MDGKCFWVVIQLFPKVFTKVRIEPSLSDFGLLKAKYGHKNSFFLYYYLLTSYYIHVVS